MNESEPLPLFSFLMTTYNDDSLLSKAIKSLQSQSFEDWELIVWDNSNITDKIWRYLNQLSSKDGRIHCYRNNESLGWAKGASICLEKAKGKYMSFLASDDFIAENALNNLAKVVHQHNADILWVGVSFVTYNDDQMINQGSNTSSFKLYSNKNRSEDIIDLMQNTYYNAFFHYVNIDFLRRNHIDFFEPYYADCVGMTKAMAEAETMVRVSDSIYYLSLNTSQTSGYYIWDYYKRTFGLQWTIITEVFQRENCHNRSMFEYVAKRISNNHLATSNALADGKCRDELMNNIYKNCHERFEQLRLTFEYSPMIEMMYFYDREVYSNELLNIFVRFVNNIGLEQFQELEPNWLWKLMNVCMIYENGIFSIVSTVSREDIDYLLDVTLDEENIAIIGFELLVNSLDYCSDKDIVTLSEKLTNVMQRVDTLNKKIENRFL